MTARRIHLAALRALSSLTAVFRREWRADRILRRHDEADIRAGRAARGDRG